jgi:hypothetical protein
MLAAMIGIRGKRDKRNYGARIQLARACLSEKEMRLRRGGE